MFVFLPQKGYGSHAMILLTEYYSEASAHADYVDAAPAEQQLAHVVQDPQVGDIEHTAWKRHLICTSQQSLGLKFMCIIKNIRE